MGDLVGALLGEAEGEGVGTPLVYVGTSVGDLVGALLGDAVGAGVGLATVVVNVTVAPLVTVRAELTVTVLVAVLTAVTIALEEPTVTVEPTDTPVVEATVTAVEVLAAIDGYYDDRSGEAGSVRTALVLRLALPDPRDARVTRELARYKGLDPRWHDWAQVVGACEALALRLAEGQS